MAFPPHVSAIIGRGITGLRSGLAVDALIVVVVFAAAAWWGAQYVRSFADSGRQPSFYQQYFEPAVMMACGRGFTIAAERPEPLDDFLLQRADAFDCASLPADLRLNPDGIYQYAWFYLMATVSLAWRLLGVSWSGLAPLFGVLFAITVVLAYGLFRFAAPPWVAAIPTLALTASSLHLQNLPHLRDYAKAPFVLALILILLCLVRRPLAPRVLLGLSAIYGTVLGVGYGFRTDLLANIPPLIVGILLFLPGGVRRNLRLKAAALALAAATFVAASWPVTSFVSERGGCQWHVVLLGLDDGFTRDLDVEPSFYGWMSAYSDEYMHASVNSYQYRMAGAPPAEYCSAEYDAASGAYLREIVSTFPADVLTRAHASVFRVLDLPFYWWYTSGDEQDQPRRSRLGGLLTSVAGAARVSAILAIGVIGAHSVRLGLFAVCVVLYFGGYPSLQFSNRHYFHLEFLGWWAMAFLGWQALRVAMAGAGRLPEYEPIAGRQMMVRGSAFVAAVVTAIVLPLPVARAYQDATVRPLVQSLLDAPRVDVPLSRSDDGRLLQLQPDATLWAPGDATHTAYLDIHVDTAACPDGVPMRLVYNPAAGLHDFSGPPRPLVSTRVPTRVLVPVYRRFEGVALDSGNGHCVTRIERLRSLQGMAMLPVLLLPAGWREEPLHQSFRLTRSLELLRVLLPERLVPLPSPAPTAAPSFQPFT